jgi:hypothetical protein
MYEYHGWATVRESAEDEDNAAILAIAGRLRTRIRELAWASGILDVRTVNGKIQLWAAGCTNHRGAEAREILELFEFIASLAPASYGILYVWDDEDENGYYNVFQVWVLTRGRVFRRLDPFLSPCVPVVQDD